MSRFGKTATAAGATAKDSAKESECDSKQGQGAGAGAAGGETLKRFRLGVGKRKVEFSTDCFIAGSSPTLPNGGTGTDATTIKLNHVPTPTRSAQRSAVSAAVVAADAAGFGAGNEKNNSEDMSLSGGGTKTPTSRTSSFIRKSARAPPGVDLIESESNHNSSPPCYCATEFQQDEDQSRDPWNKCEQLLLETCNNSSDGSGTNPAFLGIGAVQLQQRYNGGSGGGGSSGGISSSEPTTTDDDITPHSVISNLLRAPPPTSHSHAHTLHTTFNSSSTTCTSQPFPLTFPFDNTISYEDECDNSIAQVQKSVQEMSNTEWILSQQRQYNNPDLSRVLPYVHAHEDMSKPKPPPPSNASMTSTFATILRSSTLPSQAHHQQQQQRPSATLASATTLSMAVKEQKQRQWEAELDLIVPASEPSGLASANANTSSNATTASTSLSQQQPPTIHHSTDTLRNKVPLNPDVVLPNHHQHHNHTRNASTAGVKLPPEHQNSRIILIPDSTSFVPESRTGSSVRLSQSQQLSSPTDQNLKSPRRKRRIFCDGFELDLRQVCVVCGFLIVATALGVGVGVPIALELRGHVKSAGLKPDTVRKLLTEVPLIDGHNDLAWNLRKFLQNQLLEVNFDNDLRQFEPFAGSVWSHTDLKRLREGGVGAQLWSAYVPCSAQHLDAVQIAVEQIDVIKRLVDKYKDSFSLVTSVSDVERAHSQRKISSLIAVEGGHAIGNSLAILRMLYNLGARSLTLTHNCNTPWADSASSDHYLPDRGGLTEFGKLVVLESNRLGLIVDLAHVSVHTMRDALAVSRAPVIFSHSAASALCNHSRNVPDEILRLVTANGGLVMVSFYNVFIACNETASIEDVIAHIEHIREVAGVDHVGIGAGYDGINFVPTGLEDVSKYPNLVEALLGRSTWSELDLKKLIGFNFLRVFRQVEVVRDDWKKAGVGPIEEWIPKSELEGHPTLCSYRGAT